MTVGLWSRGILHEFYGIAPSDMVWVTSEPEEAGFVAPDDVKIEVLGEDPESLLLNGQADALIAFNVPKAFRKRDPRIRRVFNDCRQAILDYFEKTRIFPMTHTVVIREPLANSQPWIVEKLLFAFREANEQCQASYEYPKRLSYPTAILLMEEEEVFGENPWEHGLTCNEPALEKFIEYAHAQNYIPYKPKIRELFASDFCQ
jgi:4,5-dihydroxyphthalate decarboxylase